MSKTPLCPNCETAHADGLEIKYDWFIQHFCVCDSENPYLELDHDDDRGDMQHVWKCSNCGNEWPATENDGWVLDDSPVYKGFSGSQPPQKQAGGDDAD